MRSEIKRGNAGINLCFLVFIILYKLCEFHGNDLFPGLFIKFRMVQVEVDGIQILLYFSQSFTETLEVSFNSCCCFPLLENETELAYIISDASPQRVYLIPENLFLFLKIRIFHFCIFFLLYWYCMQKEFAGSCLKVRKCDTINTIKQICQIYFKIICIII